jgi:hypothetical protein
MQYFTAQPGAETAPQVNFGTMAPTPANGAAPAPAANDNAPVSTATPAAAGR